MAEPFSVLMCYYRGDSPSALAEAFWSVTRDQTLRPDEVVLVQDGPVPTELAEVVAALIGESPVPVEHVVLPVNGGLGPALNAGLDRCHHDVVARMDADDISLPTRFERQLALIDDGVELLGSSLLEFGTDRDDILGRRVPVLTAERIRADMRFQQTFNHPTVIYRASRVREVGGYEDLPLMEDYLLFAKLVMAGVAVANVAEPLVLYRIGEGAYARRGGTRLLRSELRLQWRFWRMGFTTPGQLVRNVMLRGVYRMVPEGVRKRAYRRFLALRGERRR